MENVERGRYSGLPKVYLRGPVKCEATTKKGTQCRNYAVWGSWPPRCAPHGGKMGEWVSDRGNEQDATD